MSLNYINIALFIFLSFIDCRSMKAVVYLFLLAGLARSDMPGECSMAGFYLELGCTPAPGNATCPDAFSCPDLHPDPKLCYYRGSPYKNGATIPQSLVNNPCSQACTCVTSPEPRFQCAAVDCVESFDNDEQQQCIYTYELDACCYTGTVCGKDAVAKLTTCEVDNQRYKEGQTFQPANTRKTCVCTDQWSGKLDEKSHCRDINCGIEIHYQEKLLENCAPVFVSNARSCPISFECPSNATKIVRGINMRSVSTQCLFGNQTLSVGDEVLVQEKCMRCGCEVPPFVSCMKLAACD